MTTVQDENGIRSVSALGRETFRSATMFSLAADLGFVVSALSLQHKQDERENSQIGSC